MATVSTYKLRDADVPLRVAGRTTIVKSITWSTGLVDSGGLVALFDLPRGVRIMDAVVNQKASLGTTGTVFLQLGTGGTALTAATTADTVTVKSMRANAVAPILLASQELELQLVFAGVANGVGVVEVTVEVEPADYGVIYT